jgi:hypothetical protein
MKPEAEDNREQRHRRLTAAILAVLMLISCASFMTFAGEPPQPEPRAAYTSAVAFGDFDDVDTWGGGGFPGSTDTWAILDGHTVNVTGAELSGSGDVNTGGTLCFNCSGGAAVLTLDDGATLTNSGTVNETGSTVGNYAALVGSSLEPMTGNQPTWSDGCWRFADIDFQMDVITGGGGCDIQCDAETEWDDITISAGDTLDSNAETIRVGGDWDSSLNSGGPFRLQ